MQTQAIQGDLTIYSAAARKAEFLAFLDSGDELELNLAGIEEIDTAGLQLLILIKREAARHDKRLTFVMHSNAVLELLELSNLTAAFGDQVMLPHDKEEKR